MKNRWWLRKSWMWAWGTLAALGGLGAVGMALWQVPWWLDAHYLPTITQPQATAVTGMRTALLAMGAGSLAVVGILYTHRTLHQNREGQVTDRYARAIGQIASDKPVEQLGGIYALERIMRDSVKDHATIVEVLAAFVREHAPAPAVLARRLPSRLAHQCWRAAGKRVAKLLHEHSAEHKVDPRPTEPVQAALTVLGRRPQGRDEPFQLNLEHTDLRMANLTGAHLEGADLTSAHLKGAYLEGAHLEGADLTEAHLEETDLSWAHLEGADLNWAHLEGANLSWAHLEGAYLIQAHLEGAYLTGTHMEGAYLIQAHMEGAYLTETHLEGVRYLTVEQVVSARPRKSTFLPKHLSEDTRVTARIDAVDKEEQ
ncbi:pentapeptide repeat-containing protein [Streptomyces wedmorensis]